MHADLWSRHILTTDSGRVLACCTAVQGGPARSPGDIRRSRRIRLGRSLRARHLSRERCRAFSFSGPRGNPTNWSRFGVNERRSASGDLTGRANCTSGLYTPFVLFALDRCLDAGWIIVAKSDTPATPKLLYGHNGPSKLQVNSQ